MLKLKRLISLVICFVFIVGAFINNPNLVLSATIVYFSPNSNANSTGIGTDQVRSADYGQWITAINRTGEVRPFSNNAFTVESNFDQYQFQIKKTPQTTMTVTKGTIVPNAPDHITYDNGTSYLNLSDDAKNNFKWFLLKYYVPNQGTRTINTVNNIQIKVNNLRVFQTDANKQNGKWVDIDVVRTVTKINAPNPHSYDESVYAHPTGYKGYNQYIALGYDICNVIYVGCYEVTVNNQFYLAGTNTPITLKTNVTCVDVDAYQSISFKKGNIVRHYLTNNTSLWYNKYLSDQNGVTLYDSPMPESPEDGIPQSATTIGFLLNGSSIEYSFGRQYGYATMQEQYIGTLSNMSGFSPVNPTKSITDSDENNVTSNKIRSLGESWTYNVEQMIPETNPSSFSSFSLRDQIDDCLDFDINSINIEATNGINSVDATSWFDITSVHYGTDHGYYRVDAVLKSNYINSLDSQFYKYQTYRLKIPVKINGSLNSSASGSFIAKMARVGHANEQRTKLNFTNIAYSYINNVQRTTNEVETTVHLPTKDSDTPGLKITKEADKFEYQVGDKVHYTVEVNNTNSEADTAYFTIKDDTLPDTIEVDSDSIEISGINSSNYTFEVNDNNWILTSKDDYSLPYGTTIKIEFDATALKPSNSHLVDNTAKTFAFGVGEHQAEAEVWINSPKLNVTKVADKSKFNLGDEITYTVEATNINEGTLAYLMFEDNITSTGVTYITNSVKVMGDDTDITNSCNINFNSALSKLTINTTHYLKNGDCELNNQKNDRGRIGYQNGIRPRSHDKITLTYKVKVVNADTSDISALLLTDGKVLTNTVKAIPGAVYNYDGSTPAVIKNDDTIPSGDDEDSSELTINDPEISVSKETNKEAYKVGNTVNYTLTIKQTKPNLIARNIGIRDTFDKDSGITLNKDSIKVFLNNEDVTNSCIIIKSPSSTRINDFYINTNKSISDQDEIKVTYNATVSKTGYYKNNVSVNSSNAPSVTDDNEIEVQVNGLPMTGQQRNLFFIFIAISILLTITIVIVRKKRKKDLIH